MNVFSPFKQPLFKRKRQGSTAIDSLVSQVSTVHAKNKTSKRKLVKKSKGEIFANSYVSWKSKSPVVFPSEKKVYWTNAQATSQNHMTDKVPNCPFHVVFPLKKKKKTEYVRIRGLIDVGSKPIP